MNNVRRFRREIDWTQKTLAEKSGLTRTQILAIENNLSRRFEKGSLKPMKPRQSTKEKIAEALGRTVDEVFPPPDTEHETAKGAVRFV